MNSSRQFPIWGLLENSPRINIAYEQWVQFPSAEFSAMQQANGRLIAAAPALLDACKAFLQAIDSNEDRVAVELAIAAIAKAERS
jgi:hypothetical protein